MPPNKRPESFDSGTFSRSRSTSLSSDSQISRIGLLSPPPVNPEPVFVSSSAASEIVTSDQEYNAVGFVGDEEGIIANDSAVVTPAALSLLNGFLDHLLFNILAAAKSTKLSCIRPAVADVLKPRLAKEVVSAADDELSEYVGGPDADVEFHGNRKSDEVFDLIRSWKLTRLRCMVYTRLGDLEEDDEEEYIAKDSLGERDGVRRSFARRMNVTPATAIFLTSIIEYIGEQALVIAGEAARTRLSAKYNDDHDELTQSSPRQDNRLVVEDTDMEKLALNATLGRLWRTWRRRIRAPRLSRTLSRESLGSRVYRHTFDSGRKNSMADHPEPVPPSSPTTETQEQIEPVPMVPRIIENDAHEVEIPTSSADGDFEIVTMEAVVAHKVRPRSLMVFASSPKTATSSASSPIIAPAPQEPKSTTRHARSKSLPNDSYAPLNSSNEDQKDGRTSRSPSLEQKHLDTMYERDEPAESVEPEAGVSTPSPQLDSSQTETQDSNDQTMNGVHENQNHSAVQDAVVDPSRHVESIDVETSQLDHVRPSGSTPSDQKQQEAGAAEGHQADEEQTSEPLEEQPLHHQRPDSVEVPEPTQSQPVVNRDTVVPPKAETSVTTPAVSSARSAGDDATTDTSPQELAQVPERTRPPMAPRGISQKTELTSSAASNRDESEGSQRRPSWPKSSSPKVPHSHRQSTSAASVGTERAAVQRLSGRPSLSITSSSYSGSRRSDSFNSGREKRPITSGSPASPVREKLKGLIGRSQGDSTSLSMRTSSETSCVSVGSGDSADDKSALDRLIHSDETIHFTLTPKNMRDIEAPECARWRAPRSSTLELAEFLENTNPPGELPPRPRASTTSSRGTISLPPAVKSRSADVPKHKTLEAAGLKFLQKPKAFQPRDARPVAESTLDFANFIRSTGPNLAANASPSRPNGVQHLQRRASDTPGTSRKLTRRGTTGSKGRSSLRLQARPAATGTAGQTSELIDFIRTGPPTVGARRIPAAVAPFRDTMDSDQLESLGPVYNESSNTEDGGSTANKSSISFGSGTALLQSADQKSPQASLAKQESAPAASENAQNGSRPGQKKSGARDPYAIDSEKEDEDELGDLVRTPKPKRELESLIDFLRNVPPPPDLDRPRQPLAANLPSSKGSDSGGFASMSSSMRARLLRKASLDRIPSLKSSRTSLLSQHTDSHVSGQSNYSVKVGLKRNPGASASTTARQTETSALADFLRNTGPPNPPEIPLSSASMTGSRTKDSGTSSLSRFFVRRKKVET